MLTGLVNMSVLIFHCGSQRGLVERSCRSEPAACSNLLLTPNVNVFDFGSRPGLDVKPSLNTTAEVRQR